MPGVTELCNAALERGETFESMGAAKASKRDLTHYVMEISQEAEFAGLINNEEDFYSDAVIAAALFRVWTGEGR